MAEFVHPDDRDGYVSSYLDAVAHRDLFEATFRFKRLDGHYRWMKSIGAPRHGMNQEFLGYVGSTLDITDIYQPQKLSPAPPVLTSVLQSPAPAPESLKEYVVALGATVLALVTRLGLDPQLGDNFPYVTFLGAVALTSAYAGWAASIFAVLLNGLAANWFFLEPRYTLALTNAAQQISYATYLCATLVIVGFGQAWRRATILLGRVQREMVDHQHTEEKLRASETRLKSSWLSRQTPVLHPDEILASMFLRLSS